MERPQDMLRPRVGAVSLLLMKGDSPPTHGGAGGHITGVTPSGQVLGTISSVTDEAEYQLLAEGHD